MKILEIKNLTLQKEERNILNELNLTLEEGKVHAIVGTNGAGKSTLAGTVMGLSGYRNYTGSVRYAGKPLEGMSIDQRARAGISLGWQEPARFEGLLVREYLNASAKTKTPEEISQALQQVGLKPADYLERAVDTTLSGGERKRIELASLLLMHPRLVILDEPDSGIDVAALEMIFNAITLLRERGATIILITHSPTVLKQAEQAYLMCDGAIIDQGSVDEIQCYFTGKCIPCDHKNHPEQYDQTAEEETDG